MYQDFLLDHGYSSKVPLLAERPPGGKEQTRKIPGFCNSPWRDRLESRDFSADRRNRIGRDTVR
jgi:hypothetical protein